MMPVDTISVVNPDRHHDLVSGHVSIGSDWARVHMPGTPDCVLPDKDIHGMDVVASRNGDVKYAGTIWEVSDKNTVAGNKITLRCKPAHA